MAVDRPELTDGVVRLRAHSDDDIDAMVEMCRDPEMARWTSVPQPYDRDNAKRFARELVPHGWETGEWRGWAIEATDDTGRARFAGNVDIRGVGVADIGYALHPWARGRGVVTRAIRLATRWAFDHGGVEIVHWRAHAGNVASRRTAWAAGFTFHGTVPKLLHERGRAIDTWIASLQPDASGEPRTRWLVPPVLQGERVTLRPFRDDDVPYIVEACSDPRTRQWLANLPDPYSESDARQWLLSGVENQSIGESVTWCVADPDSDELLANVAVFGLAGPKPFSGELGYWAHPKARGRGAMTEAVGLVTGYAFAATADGGLGLRRLQIGAAVDNSASRRVAIANGFTEVGRDRGAEQLGDGTYTDLVWYDRLATD
jgi:[ribosomal protein S5]-alanine N-acetyltransferase